jgi:predicted transcriptional regulator
MSSGTLRHHLKTLERSNMVSSHREGKYLYYFPYGARKAGHILTPAQKEIVDIIHKEPGATTQQVAEKLGKTRRAVQHHMNDLSDIGVLKVEKMGRAPVWHLDDEQWGRDRLT